MSRRKNSNGNINLSLKWVLRFGAIFSLLITLGVFFIPQTVYLNIVGLFFAGSIICLVLAEIATD